MTQHNLSSPSAAEHYFDTSLVGQLYLLMAGALAGPAHGAPGGRAARHGAAVVHRPAPAEAPPAPATVTGAQSSGLFERFDRWCWRQEQKAREAYLASSADVFELERRIRALERGVPRRFY